MEKNKNKILLIIILIVTVLLVFAFTKFYKNNYKKQSVIFEYAKEIRPNDFSQYMVESTDIIILVSDKYDISNDIIFEKLINDLNKNDLKDKLICIDKNLIKDSFLSTLRTVYDIDLDISKIPAIILVSDRVVENISYLNNDTDLEKVIDYQEFK